MDYQNLIEKAKKLEALFPKVFDLFEQEIQQLKNDQHLDSASSLSAACEKINQDGRLLNIGIVGRVKAGKSSLLNALFFDGQNILPKAATPMTAALTTLTYGEKFSASVEFFTAEDLRQITHNASLYAGELSRIKEKKFQEISARPATSSSPDIERLTTIIDKQALQEIQTRMPEVCASHDQYERMQKSGLTPADLQYAGAIEPENREALSVQLLDYVGANGKYMPYTKVVHISMPLDALKDICVIDTPGMNDPVQSREARTVDLLKTCDVVFIVSPAGQFLNENDLEVIGRITAKEGVQELVLIASQIDTQLYGSEKRPLLNQTLDNIKASLAKRASATLSNLKRSYPEIGTVFDSIIRAPAEHLMHCSGVAQGISCRLETPSSWDANELKTWENLTEDYGDYFSRHNPQLTQNSLASLANIDNIHQKIAAVRDKKDDIMAQKMQSLITQKEQVITRFIEELLQKIRQRITLINSTDLGALAKQSNALVKQRNVLDKRINLIYENCVNHYYNEVSAKLNIEADKLFQQTSQSVEDQRTTETISITRDKAGAFSWVARKLWDGGKETTSKTQTLINTAAAEESLRKFIRMSNEKLKTAANEQHSGLEKEISKNITPKIDEILEGECDVMMIADVILSVVNQIPKEKLTLNINFPDGLRAKGTLKGDPADDYIDEADNFITNIRTIIDNDIEHYFSRVKNTIPPTISSSFVEELDNKINQIANQVENSTQTIDRLQRFTVQLQEVQP